MSTNEVRSNDAARNAGVAKIDMKLEVAVIPVSDVDCGVRRNVIRCSVGV
ncbi:MAG: hypothetical protein WA510_13975 [Acidobacteriaceae bacterium]